MNVPPDNEPQFSVMPLMINEEFTPNVIPNTKNNAAVMPAMRALSPSTTRGAYIIAKLLKYPLDTPITSTPIANTISDVNHTPNVRVIGR